MITSSDRDWDSLFNAGKHRLRDAFYCYYLSPEMKGRTVEAYKNALAHWEAYTTDPPFREISNTTLQEFKNRFLADYSAGTFNKVRRHLLALLNKLAPAVKGNPGGLGQLEHFVFVTKARQADTPPRVAGTVLLSEIYQACKTATWPRVDFPAADWWRALVVFLYNTGLRRNDFLALKTRDVDLVNHCLTFRAEKTGKSRVLPLHPAVIDHFRRIWSDRELVFPKPAGNKSLYLHWHKLQDAAGLARDEHITFHQLRATCGSNLFERSPGAAQEMLGHSSIETTRRHYTNLSRQLKELATSAEQPDAFTGGTDDGPENDDGPAILRFPA